MAEAVAEAVVVAVVAGTVRSGAGTVFSTVTVRADGTGGAACSRLLLIRPRRNPKSSATANTTSTNATNLASPAFLLPWMTLLLPILLSLRSSSRTHTRTAGEVGPSAPSTHTSLPNAYAATSEAVRKDPTQPHVRRLIPRRALSEATTTLAKAHNSAPTTNASHGSPMGGVGRGIGPVLPMFRATRARQTNGVPTRTHQKPTESFSRDSLPLLAHPTCPGPRVAATAEFTLHKITAVRTSWNAVNAKFAELTFYALR